MTIAASSSMLQCKILSSRIAKGFSLLELGIASCLISVLLLVFLDRMLFYQEAGEMTAVETDIFYLRTAVKQRMLEMLLKQKEKEVPLMEGANPVPWLERSMPNYLGEMGRPEWAAVPEGSWYFEKNSRTLVYKVKRGRHFLPAADGKKAIKLKVELSKVNGNTALPLRNEGITLTIMEPYQWFSENKSPHLP